MMSENQIKYKSHNIKLVLERCHHGVKPEWIDPADIFRGWDFLYLLLSLQRLFQKLRNGRLDGVDWVSMLFDFESWNHQILIFFNGRSRIFFFCVPKLLVHEDSSLFELFKDEFGSWELYLQFLRYFSKRLSGLDDRVDQDLTFLNREWCTLREIWAYRFLLMELVLMLDI